MQASDNGSPPRVATTTVNIDVSDVNDNAPVFSRGNYSLIIQVTVGPGLLECVPVEMCALTGLDYSFEIAFLFQRPLLRKMGRVTLQGSLSVLNDEPFPKCFRLFFLLWFLR